MALIDWIPSYNTGIIEVDLDNQQIVSFINLLHDSITKKDNHEIVNQIVYQLANNFQDHCTVTSQTLSAINYPFLGQQQDSHKKFGRILSSFLMRVKKEEKISPMEMIGFLRNWFDKHIKIEDQQLKMFIKKNKCNLDIKIMDTKAKQIEWNKSLELNNEEIDKEHKYLVDLYNVFFRAVEAKKSKSSILKILQTFKQYTELHFKSEEKIMKQIDYVELAEHTAMHRKLIDDIDKLLKIISENKAISNKKLLEFTRNWLVRHIVTEDKKIITALAENKELVS